MKITVLELSTGNKEVEEWTFSPEGSNHPLNRRPIIQKNFVFLEFGDILSGHTDDILILNLVTRIKFWLKKRDIITKLKEKVADMVDILNSQMIVETDRIVIKYRIRTHNGALWWFSNSNIHPCRTTFTRSWVLLFYTFQIIMGGYLFTSHLKIKGSCWFITQIRRSK